MQQRLNEDGSHLFFKCKHVAKVWQALNREGYKAAIAQMQDANKVVRHIIAMKEEEQLQMVLVFVALVA